MIAALLVKFPFQTYQAEAVYLAERIADDVSLKTKDRIA
jgi:hypothetical protein